MPVRFATSRARRKLLAAFTSFLLIMSMAGTASADVGAVTVTGQAPNPVAAGNVATYTVSFQNTDATAHMFAATAMTGPTGTSIQDGGCASVAGGATAHLTVKVATTTSTPIGTSNIRITVTEYSSTSACSDTVLATTQSANNAASIVVRNPLALTYYKAICTRYTDVPSNRSPSSLDATGGYWQELNTSYQTALVNPATDLPAACPTNAGWSFQLKDGQNGNVIDTRTTGAGGSVTVNLTDAEINLARGGGLWLQEITQPAAAGFGALRCYNDNLNGDNLENMQGVPEATTQIYCIAYNVGGAGISLTKTADTTTYVLGQTIHYTYNVIDTGYVNTGSAQFTASDDKVNAGTAFNCGATANLTPNTSTVATPSAGSFVSCQTSHVVTQADVDAGTITNTAHADYTFAANSHTSGNASVTVTGPAANASLSLTKTANPTVFSGAGASIGYTYVLTNNGNRTLTGPITVTDNKITGTNTVSCPATLSLAPGAAITCTATYKTVAADSTAGFVTNTAIGTAYFGATPVTATAQATVNRATLTITADNKTKVYGSANPAFTVSYSGFLNGDTAASMGGTLACTSTGTNGAVGSYPITCSGLTNSNYTIVWMPGTLSVTPKALTVTVNSNSKTYGTTFATGAGSTAFTQSGQISGNPVATITIASTGAAATAAAGTYPIVGSAAVGTGLGNYTITYVDGTLTVNPAALTVTASNQSKPYGTTMPTGAGQTAFTTNGLINGDTVATVSLASAGAAANAPRGNYSIVPSAAVGTGLGNYTISYVNGTLNVGMGALTITATDNSKTYGTTFPVGAGSRAFTASGLVGTDSVTSITIASTGSAGTATVGSYPIVPSAAVGPGVGNYTITYVNGSLTVNPKALTVTASNNSKTYGDTIAVGTGQTTGFTTSGLVNTDTVTSVTLASAGAPVTATVAGSTYSIVPSVAVGSGLGNYTISYANGSLTVNPKALTITASNNSKTYGGTIAVGTGQTAFTSNGLINTDTVTSVTLASAGAPVTATVAGSTYSIVPSVAVGSGLGNYTITYANGSLTVNPKQLTITASNQNKAYGTTMATGPGQTTGFTTAGLINGDTVASVTLTSTGAPATSALGTYSIVPSAAVGIGLGNYTASYANGTLTVGKGALTITANNASKTYGSAFTVGAGSTAFTSAGLVGIDSVSTVTIASTGSPATAIVGTYHIVPSAAVGTGLDNYNITYSDGTLTVNKALLTITGSNGTMVYGDPGPTIAPLYSGWVNGEGTGALTNPATCYPSATSTSPVGNGYTTDCAAAVAANYSFKYVVGSFSVTPKPLTITASDQSKAYGVNFGLGTSAFTTSAIVGTDSVSSVTLTSTGAAANAPVNTYPIVPSAAVGTGLGNYTITYADGTLTVTRPILVITAPSPSRTYGSSNPTLTPSFTGFVAGDTSASLTTQPTCITLAGVNSAPGTYAVTCSGGVDPNYDIHYTDGVLTVTKATLDITASDGTMVYGSTVPTIAPIYSGFVGGDTAGNLTIPATCYPSAISPVGNSYYTYCGGAADANYTIKYHDGKFSVTPADLTIAAKDQGKTYGDTLDLSALGTAGFNVFGLAGTDTVTGATLTSAGTSAGSQVGPYAITPNAATGNGLGNYTIHYAQGMLWVNPAALTITAKDQSKTFGTALDLAALATTGFTTSGLHNSDQVLSAAVNSPGATAFAAVGSYAMTIGSANGLGLDNYTIKYINGKLTVGAKALTITADDNSKIYGTELTLGAGSTAFTTSGLIGLDSVDSVTLTSSGAAASASTGTYSIVPSLALGTGLGNYSITYDNGTLSVDAKALTITAKDHSKTYGDTLDMSTLGTTGFTTSGLVNGDSVASVTLVSAGAPASAIVKTYDIVPRAAIGGGLINYAITYDNGTLTVTKAILTVTGSNGSMVYGGTVPTIDPIYSGWVNGDGPSGLTTQAICSVSAVSPVGSGYTTDCSGASSSNYDFVYFAGNFSVTPAALTITASNQSKTYGSPIDLGTTAFTTSGLVSGDSVSGVTLASAGSDASAPVTTYPIVPSAAVGTGLGNYIITYKNGTLTVTKATLDITASDGTMVYGGTVPTIDPIYSGWVNGDSSARLTNPATCYPSAISPVGSGYYTYCAGAVDPNYTINYHDGTFSVTKADLTITADNDTKTYGTALTLGAGSTAFTKSGLVGTDSVATVTLASTGAPASAGVGSYPIVPSAAVGTGLGNYTITYANGTVAVTKAALTVTAPSPTMPYGGPVPTLTPTYSGFGAGDVAADLTTQPACSTTAVLDSPLGTYPVTCSGAASPNYDISYVDGTLTVGKITVTITASSATFAYGSPVPAITPTYTGFVNGDTAAAALTSQPTCTTPATSTSSVGSYASSCSGAASEVYLIAYTDGNVAVTKAMLTVTGPTVARDYGAPNPSLPPSFAGYVNGEDATAMSTAPACDTGANTSSLPGSYPVTCSGGVSDDYDFTYVDGALTVGAIPAPALAVTKTPSRTTYNAAGQAIVYTFTLKNVGNVTLYGPFTVTDVPLGQVDCAGSSLDPGATLTSCETKSYTTTQADLDGNATITDTATGHAFADIILVADVAPNARVQVDSEPVTVNVTGSQGPELTLVKAATETSFTVAGEVLHYTYTLTNTGNVTLDGPFTVADDKITDPNKVVCDAADGLQLKPGQSIVCTAAYTVTVGDLEAGKVVNTAIGHARLVETDIASTAKVVTVTQKGLETVLSETAAPSHAVTPPPTNGDAGSSGGNPAPLLALLICFAFGGLGLLAIEIQRRSIRR